MPALHPGPGDRIGRSLCRVASPGKVVPAPDDREDAATLNAPRVAALMPGGGVEHERALCLGRGDALDRRAATWRARPIC